MTFKKSLFARVAGWRGPPVPAPEPEPTSAAEEDSFDVAIEEYEKRRELTISAAPEPQKPPLDPAEVAAAILLGRAMQLLPVLVEELRFHGTVSVVTVPDGTWAEPVYAAWKSSISGKEFTANVSRSSSLDRRNLQPSHS